MLVAGALPVAALAVDLDAAPSAPSVYAAEIAASPSVPVVLGNGFGTLDLSTPLAYSFAPGEARHARFECPATLRFAAGSTVVASDPASVTLGALNGLGTSAVTFSVTAVGSGLTATDRLTLSGDRILEAPTDARCRFALYDTPSQALAGGSAGRIALVEGAYLRFAPSVGLRVDRTGVAIADVEAVNGPYTRFTPRPPTSADTLGQLGRLSYGTSLQLGASVQPLWTSGAPSTLADLMGADTALVVDGDMAGVVDVFLSPSDACASVSRAADTIESDRATFVIADDDAMAQYVCLRADTVALNPSSYRVSIHVDPAGAGVNLGDLGDLELGRVDRNGTELMAPLVQMPVGSIARIALSNTGTDERRATVEWLRMDGGSPSEASSLLPGLTSAGVRLPARGTVVVDLADLFARSRFIGVPRGSVRVVVAAPTGQIQGVYQVVNPSAGTLSNHVMVRPGSN